MDAQQAFTTLVQRCLIPEKAKRYIALCDTKKGKEKILDSLWHQFESAIRTDAIRDDYDKLWSRPCFVYYANFGFGVEFTSVCEAYDQLPAYGGWLIVLRDGSAGIHRPEAKSDDEKMFG